MAKQTVPQQEAIESQSTQQEVPEQAGKKVSVFLQAKGGVGKSFLGYLRVLASDTHNTAAVLLDSSQKANQNAGRHTKTLGAENVHVLNIDSANHEYKRNHFFDIFEQVSMIDRPFVILDIGAPESHVFRTALEYDNEMTAENLKYMADDLGLELTFNVVVSGADDNINENLNYFVALDKALKDYFRVNMLINDVTFKEDNDSESLRNDLISESVASEQNVFIVGQSGQRHNDNAYLTIMSLANGDVTLDEARKSIGARIRLRNMLEPLALV